MCLIFLSSCENVVSTENDNFEYVDFDDLTTQSYDNVNLNSGNYFFIKDHQKDKILFAKEIVASELISEYQFNEESPYYCCFTFFSGLDNESVIKPEIEFENRLNYFFSKTKWAEACLDKNVLHKYLSHILISKDNVNYDIDFSGHLIYENSGKIYRSSLKIELIDVFKHYFYLKEEFYNRQITLKQDDTYKMNDKSLTFDDISSCLDYTLSDVPRFVKTLDNIYLETAGLNFEFNGSIPYSDMLSIGENVQVSRDGKIYSGYESFTILDLFSRTFNLNVPYVLKSNIGDIFNGVFALFDAL